MLEWEATGRGFRVHDSAGVELSFGGSNLSFSSPQRELPRPVDVAVDCTADELVLPGASAYVSEVGQGRARELGADTEPLALPAGDYLVDLDAEIKTYLRLNGPFALSRTADYDGVVLSVPDRRRVTLGFRATHRRPTASLTTPPTPEGLATAITHASVAHRTLGPDRSYPTLRGHPPLVELGETVDVPDRLREATPETGIELLAPSSLEPLLVCAPLAYYLGADVQTTNAPSPILRAPAADVEVELPAMPGLERDATRLFRKVFFMDCLVRNAGPYGTDLAEASLLDALGVDADPLYEASPAERLAAYIDVPYGAIEQRLPDWHLSTYVEPDAEGIAALPFLLDRMSLVYMPRTSELEGGELVERSLDDFYRGSGPVAGAGLRDRSTSGARRSASLFAEDVLEDDDSVDADGDDDGDSWLTRAAGGAGEVASVDIVKPELRDGRIHGWLADGTPIDVFKCLPEAYEHRLEALAADVGEIEVAVVLNDPEMQDEHADVAEIYRARGGDVSVDVSVHERLSTTELRELFEAERDFVHYIGHCEEDGLRCPDGYVSASDLDRCGAQTFFLNACGSYHEGVELVRSGAVTGAITFSQVLNDHAVAVGSTFARLLAHGFGFERALQVARRRIMMGKDYAVVGDGTHSLAQSENRLPATARLEPVDEEDPDEDRFLLTYDQYSSRHAGSFYRPFVGDRRYARLCGNESEHVLERDELAAFLERAELPVIYDGDVYWSDDLVAEFQT